VHAGSFLAPASFTCCFVTAGGNFIDTASLYQAGDSETWIGEFVKESKTITRDDVVIATKYTLPEPLGKINGTGACRCET
jgi:aryl-alcohol dehydrogenase-like predicted oxidoreductase